MRNIFLILFLLQSFSVLALAEKPKTTTKPDSAHKALENTKVRTGTEAEPNKPAEPDKKKRDVGTIAGAEFVGGVIDTLDISGQFFSDTSECDHLARRHFEKVMLDPTLGSRVEVSCREVVVEATRGQYYTSNGFYRGAGAWGRSIAVKCIQRPPGEKLLLKVIDRCLDIVNNARFDATGVAELYLALRCDEKLIAADNIKATKIPLTHEIECKAHY